MHNEFYSRLQAVGLNVSARQLDLQARALHAATTITVIDDDTWLALSLKHPTQLAW